MSEWLNVALLTLIPKKAGPNAAAYSAKAANFRPLTLADMSQKLVAKVVEHVLAVITTCCAHAFQTGFVGGRSMMESVLRIDGAIEEYLTCITSDDSVVCFCLMWRRHPW